MALVSKEITTPDLGGAADVTVIEILVKPGDTIEVNAPIVTIESDKATMEVPSIEAGIVKAVHIKVGDKITSGSALLTLDSADVASKAVKESKKTTEKLAPLPSQPLQPEQKATRTEKASAASVQSTTPSSSGVPMSSVLSGTVQSIDVHAGPGVRRLAREFGVNLALVSGSGPKQRILKEDVQAFVKGQLRQIQTGTMGMTVPALPQIDFAQFGPIHVQALSRIKKIAGKNLQRNWMMIPHVTQFGTADITELEVFRQAQKNSLEKQKIKLTPLVFIMKAVVNALKSFPHFNASLEVSGESLVMKNYFHLGVAVDTPDGLVVPVIRHVDKKGLVELAQELAQISEKARQKQLMPGEMQGGCFSISSLGGIGGTAFTPIINYPEVAILGVSKAAYQPVYQEGAFVPRLMLPLSLSYDHRVIDGADGARFIVHLTSVLSDIRNLLL